MRFFAHDGKTTHGPAGIDELLKIPGFDGDTLVCPVGSADTADWKPALAYAPFKKALLEAPAPAAAAFAAASPTLPPAPVTTALPPMPSLAPMPVLPPSPPVPAPFVPPAPAPVPVAAPAPATIPCPKCAHKNLLDAVFCNACGARMDGSVPEPPRVTTPAIPPAAAPVELDPIPGPDPFAGFDSEAAAPAFAEPVVAEPRRPAAPAPGKMGRLAEIEDAGPKGNLAPEPAFVAPSVAPALAPEPAPAVAAAAPAWKRPPVIAAFASAAIIASGAAYVLFGSHAAPLPAEPVAELTPAAPPAPVEPPTPVVFNSAPPPSPPPLVAAPKPAPAAKAPKAPRAKRASEKPESTSAQSDFKPVPRPRLGAPKQISPKNVAIPKRTRKPRPARAPKPVPPPEETASGEETIIESKVAETPKPSKRRAPKAADSGKDPLLEALLTDATEPGAEPAPQAAEPLQSPGESAAPAGVPQIGQRPSRSGFSLPGLDRPANSSDRAPAAAKAAAEDVASNNPATDPEIAGLGEPGKSSPPPGIENEPAPAKPAEDDQLALVQVHEQFDFCAQLLAQGAFGDHFDTCLCKDAREAAPYRGRRGYYVSAKKKEAGSGKLESSAKILSSKLGDGAAIIKARWKSGGADKGRDVLQTWKLEDGLWCQAP